MVRWWLAAILALIIPAAAFASCPTTSLTFKDASSATQTLCYGGASGAYVPNSNPIDASGNPITATLGATAPASGLLIGLKSSGGNLVAWPLGTDTLPEISASNLTIAAGSTTSSNLGSLIFAGVVTANQALTAGLSYPISMDPIGNLRVGLFDFAGTSLTIGPSLSAAAIPVTIAPDQVLRDSIERLGGWPIKTSAPGVQQVSLAPGVIPPQPAAPPGIQLIDVPVVQAASYSSGNCMGGFRAVPVPAGIGSLFVTRVRVTSISGLAATITPYVFSQQPKASTCTDKSTFTLGDSDLVVGTPQSITLAAPTGATPAMQDETFLPPPSFQLGTSRVIWYALVAGATESPGTPTDIHVAISIVGIN